MKKTSKITKNEVSGTILSENISNLMYMKRLKASDINEELGVTRQMVYDYMKGKSVPGKVVLDKIARLLGVTVASLYTKRDELNELKEEVSQVITTDMKYIQSLENQIELLKKLLSTCEDRLKQKV